MVFMSQRVETRQLVGMLVDDALRKANVPPVEVFEKRFVENAINYVLADHYRHTVVNFDDPDLWIDWYLNDILTVVIGALRDLLGDPNLPAGAEGRLDILESRLNKHAITSLS